MGRYSPRPGPPRRASFVLRNCELLPPPWDAAHGPHRTRDSHASCRSLLKDKWLRAMSVLAIAPGFRLRNIPSSRGKRIRSRVGLQVPAVRYTLRIDDTGVPGGVGHLTLRGLFTCSVIYEALVMGANGVAVCVSGLLHKARPRLHSSSPAIRRYPLLTHSGRAQRALPPSARGPPLVSSFLRQFGRVTKTRTGLRMCNS